MSIRALLLQVGLLAGFAAGVAVGQVRPRMWTDVVFEVTTDEVPRKTRVRANVNHWDAGSETGRHTHPGPIVFIMLEGELEEVLPDGRTRTLRAGQAFWKPPRTDHNVKNVSDRRAQALAVHLDPAP